MFLCLVILKHFEICRWTIFAKILFLLEILEDFSNFFVKKKNNSFLLYNFLIKISLFTFIKLNLREEWDSNPRKQNRFSGFQDRHLRPLSHLPLLNRMRWDSNSKPSDYKSNALPLELHILMVKDTSEGTRTLKNLDFESNTSTYFVTEVFSG